MSILGKLITTTSAEAIGGALEEPGRQVPLGHISELHRKWPGLPPDYLLEQIAASLKLPPEVLYFWARRMPPDVVPAEYIDADHIIVAFRLFRAALKRDSGRTSAGVVR